MVLALHFDLVENDKRGIVTSQLVDLIKERDTHLSTGFIGTPYLLHSLSDNNELELAYELLLKQDYPSWLYPITLGATTIWEHWDGIKADGSFWDTNMNSYNHYAYGSVGRWLYDVIGGLQIDISRPGYKHFIIAPKMGGGISYAKVTHITPFGEIKSAWRMTENKFFINVQIPCDTTATIIAPTGETKEVGSGEYSLEFC